MVDTFRIPALIDPTAYAAGGQMESMLTWAVGEVARHKIDLVLPARSVEKAGAYLISMGYDEALTPLLGESRTEHAGAGARRAGGHQPVQRPGASATCASTTTIGMFNYDYRDDAGYQRTVWIENAASIRPQAGP